MRNETTEDSEIIEVVSSRSAFTQNMILCRQLYFVYERNVNQFSIELCMGQNQSRQNQNLQRDSRQTRSVDLRFLSPLILPFFASFCVKNASASAIQNLIVKMKLDSCDREKLRSFLEESLLSRDFDTALYFVHSLCSDDVALYDAVSRSRPEAQHVGRLPSLLFCHVLSFLTGRDLFRLMTVNRAFLLIVSRPESWPICLRFGSPSLTSSFRDHRPAPSADACALRRTPHFALSGGSPLASPLSSPPSASSFSSASLFSIELPSQLFQLTAPRLQTLILSSRYRIGPEAWQALTQQCRCLTCLDLAQQCDLTPSTLLDLVCLRMHACGAVVLSLTSLRVCLITDAEHGKHDAAPQSAWHVRESLLREGSELLLARPPRPVLRRARGVRAVGAGCTG